MWRSTVVLMLTLAVAGCGGDQPALEGDSPEDITAPVTDAEETTTTESTTRSSEDEDSEELLFADHLAAGDCFDDQVDSEGNHDYARPPIMVECDQPHDNEVVLVTEYPAGPDDSYPGHEALDDHFAEVCIPAFNEFLGITDADDPPLGGYYLSPADEQEWATGSRNYACILYLPGEAQLEGTVAGAGQAVFPAGFPDDAPTPQGLELSFVNVDVESAPGEDEWDVDPAGLNVARYGHDAAIAEAKDAFLAAVDASGWTIERRDGYGSLGLGTEFFDVRKGDRQLIVEVWELESGATSLDYIYSPES